MKIDFNNYALIDIFDAYVMTDTDDILCYSKNLTTTDVKGTSEEVKIQNGKMNKLWSVIHSNKEINIELKTNLFNFGTLALISGGTIQTNDGTYFCESSFEKVKEGEFYLLEEPKYPERVRVMIEGEKVIPSINGRLATVDTRYNDKQAEIMPYEYETDDIDDIEYMTLDAENFPENVKLVLKTYVKNKKNGIYKNLTLEFPQCSIASEWNMSTSSKVEPSESTISLSVLSENGRMMNAYMTPYKKNKEPNFNEDTVGKISFLESGKYSTVEKDTDGTGNPPYQLFKINYIRKGQLASVRCEVSDKDTGELYYAETNTTKLTEGQDSFIWSLRKGLADYNTMTQDQKDAVERTNDTQLPKGTEIVIKLIMTDTNGISQEITDFYTVTAKDVRESKFV